MSDNRTIARHVSLAELAQPLGVARTTALSWTKQGMPYIRRADRDQGIPWVFDTAEVIRWRERQAARAASGETPLDFVKAQTRKMAAEAELAELKLAKERSDAVSIRDTEKVWSELVTNFRAKLLALPQRLAPILVDQHNERVIVNLLQEEIHQALDELSRTTIDVNPYGQKTHAACRW